MLAPTRRSALRFALVAVGLVFAAGVPLLMRLWPSGWQWQPGQSEYEQMIVGVYAVLGVFLLVAARNPERHASLIWFAALSSLMHGGIMLVQALRDPLERGHLAGDVPALIVVGLVFAALAPHGQQARSGSPAGDGSPARARTEVAS